MEREPKFKFDLQGLIRTGVMLVTMVGGYYHMIGVLSERAAANENKIKALEQKVDAHVQNTKVYSWEELNREFVSRREWESNHKSLRDDMKYIRDKMDAIYNKLSDSKKF